MLAMSDTFKEYVSKLYGRIISGVFHEDSLKHRWDYVNVCFDMAGNLFRVFLAHLSSPVCQAPFLV